MDETAAAAAAAAPVPPEAAALLAAWLSPANPLGAFAYSHGLEQAVADGAITGRAEAEAWIADAMAHGAGRADAILLVHSHACWNDPAAIAGIAELARAFAPSAERLLESTAQGAALAAIMRTVWGLALSDAPLPVALGAAAGAKGVPVAACARHYLQAFASTLAGACVRLVPLGQTDGQRVIAGLMPVAAEVAEAALSQPLDALGGCAFALDIAAMRHEIMEPRLFRS